MYYTNWSLLLLLCSTVTPESLWNVQYFTIHLAATLHQVFTDPVIYVYTNVLMCMYALYSMCMYCIHTGGFTLNEINIYIKLMILQIMLLTIPLFSCPFTSTLAVPDDIPLRYCNWIPMLLVMSLYRRNHVNKNMNTCTVYKIHMYILRGKGFNQSPFKSPNHAYGI